MSTIDKVLSLIKQLSSEELDRVVAECKALRQFSHTNIRQPQGPPVSDAEELLKVVHLYCVTRGLDMRPPDKLKKVPQYSSFAEKAPAVMKFLRSFCDHRNKISVILLLVFDDMKDHAIPTTAGTIMGRIHMVPAIVDKMFPGYVKSSLLPLVSGQIK